jgi:zinc protease
LFVPFGCASKPWPEPTTEVGFTLKSAETLKLKNGVELYFIEDTELPFVSGTLYADFGQYNLPQSEWVTANAMGDLLRVGGAGSRSADELDRELERLSAGISTDLSSEYGSIAFSSLSTDFEAVLKLFVDVLTSPRFEQGRLDNWRDSALEKIKRRSDDPSEVANITFQQILYRGTIYDKVRESKDVMNISRTKLISLHQQVFNLHNARLVISGNIKKDHLVKLLEKYLPEKTRRIDSTARKIVKPNLTDQSGIYFIEGEWDQSTIIIGHGGFERFNDEQYHLEPFNRVFGAGGFTSYLMRKIRVENGLAYGTYGSMTSDVIPGKNFIIVQTKAESTTKAMGLAFDVLADFKAGRVKSADLVEHLNGIRNSYVFKYESPLATANRQVLLDLLKYPKDYDTIYLDRVLKTEVQDLQRLAQNYWQTDKFIIVVAGSINAYNLLEAEVKNKDSALYQRRLRKVTFKEKAEL